MIIIFLLLIGFFFLLGKTFETAQELPVFAKEDTVIARHQSFVELKKIFVRKSYEPNIFLLKRLLSDYSDLWAHLNLLFNTNKVEMGKEYYTEDWFKNICQHYTINNKESSPRLFTRKDHEHHLYIKAWAWDGLVCDLIDSNAIFTYYTNNKLVEIHKITMAMVLLLQGDHWKIDALKILQDSSIPLYAIKSRKKPPYCLNKIP